MKYLSPNLLLALLTFLPAKEAKNKATFKFNSDHFKGDTGLTNEHDATLKKLDWYFEDLKHLAS